MRNTDNLEKKNKQINNYKLESAEHDAHVFFCF